MLKRLAKRLALMLGVEIRHAPDRDLPFVREIAFDGGTFRFWIANQHTKRWWDNPTLKMNAEFQSLRDLCKPGSVVFDVGAHHGMETLLFSRWTGASGRVFAFEANPDNALVLQANVGLNRALNCEVAHAAAGPKSGALRLVDETVGDDGDPSARAVPMVALDDFCDRAGITAVDLLKIDVEGFEGQVLMGARKLLAKQPALAVELHLDDLSRYGSSPGSVLGMVDLTRYQGRMMVRPDWDTLRPFTGLGDLPGSGVVNLFLAPRPK